jgi:dUTP pyrophosphatase
MNDQDFLKQITDEFLKLQQKYSEETPVDSEDGILSETLKQLQEELYNDSIKSEILIQRIHEDAILPSYAYPTDSGFDLCSVEEITIEPFGRALVSTGLRANIPQGFEIQIRPKSGLAIKEGITVLNTPGTVDQGYNGELKVIVFNTNNNPFTIKNKMKIAQAVLCPVASGRYVTIVEVDNVEETERGENGFGSTGLNLQ